MGKTLLEGMETATGMDEKDISIERHNKIKHASQNRYK
jgi:hypothetical protein